MTDQPAAPSIAAPSFPAFLAAYGIWGTAVTLVLAYLAARDPDPVWSPIVVLLALVPLLGTARWVARAPTAGRFFARAVAMHALAPLLPVLVNQLAGKMSEAHGGVFLLIVVVVPYLSGASAIVGLLAASVSFGVMRALRGRGDAAGAGREGRAAGRHP